MNSTPEPEEGQEPSDPSDQPPEVMVPQERLAEAASEGAQAERQADRLEAGEAEALKQTVQYLNLVLASVGNFAMQTYKLSLERGMHAPSSRDTAYWEGRRELSEVLMDMLRDAGVGVQ